VPGSEELDSVASLLDSSRLLAQSRPTLCSLPRVTTLGGGVVRNPPVSAGDFQRLEFDPRAGKIP